MMNAELESLERDLDVFGFTGVDNKLQDKVKQTLESLKNVRITIWMPTGDKNRNFHLQCIQFKTPD